MLNISTEVHNRTSNANDQNAWERGQSAATSVNYRGSDIIVDETTEVRVK